MNETGLELVAVHERFIVVHKSAGLSFHEEDGLPGVAEQARRLTGLETLHPLHRLDKPTSGLILLARDADTASELGRAFAEHRVTKYYLALTEHNPKKKQGWVSGDMVKARNGRWRLAPGRTALTWFCSRGLGEPGGGALRLFLLRPYSGRTHQLRVAMKSLGSPILGDVAYGGAPADRCYLHAWRLAFELGGESFCFQTAPVQGQCFAEPRTLDAVQAWTQDLPQAPLRHAPHQGGHDA